MTMLKELRSEHGAYTLEACISLMAMVIAIAFVYSQVKVVICESIMQHAVDNMALEVSSYVYILDKAGVVIHAEDDRFKDIDAVAEDGYKAYESGKSAFATFQDSTSSLTDLLGLLDSSEGSSGSQIKSDAKSMVGSLKKMLSDIKTVDIKNTAIKSAVTSADGLVTLLVDEVMAGFYDWKLDGYLPMPRDEFCKSYYIDPDSISFKNSRVFPGMKNNSVVVVVEYKTTSPFSMFPISRTVVKQAYTAAWLADPQ